MSVKETSADDATSRAMKNLARISVGALVVCGLAYAAYLGYEVYQRGVVETLLR